MNWDNYGTYWEIDHIVPITKGINMFNSVGIYIESKRYERNKNMYKM